ncbi:MAG: flagellar biosynthesis protein FlhF [Myxococcota bacterium]|jgi:flagellar biosynthesis protein FlhF
MTHDDHNVPRGQAPAGLRGRNPKAYYGQSVRDALEKVKHELGDQAVIMSTRDLGAAAHRVELRYEVMAAPPTPMRQQKAPTTRTAAELPRVKRVVPPTRRIEKHEAPAHSPPPPPLPEPAPAVPDAAIRRRLTTLESTLSQLGSQLGSLLSVNESVRDELQRRPNAGQTLSPGTALLAPLLNVGVEREVAEALFERARRRSAPRAGVALAEPPDLFGEVERTIRVAAPLWNAPTGSVCALLGGTGVGKTSTLLKIAGVAMLEFGRSVAVISTDVARIGTFESLGVFSDVMGFSVAAAHNRSEVDDALEDFADRDLVLIDTPGHNPFDDGARDEVLTAVSGREVSHHLVLPASLTAARMRAIVERFQGPALESLIVTKLDEAQSAAPILSACWASDLPVSHMTDGQDIPADIHAADRRRITRDLISKAS